LNDKPKAKPWPGTKRQIWAYCILVKEFVRENYPEHLNKRILAVLRNGILIEKSGKKNLQRVM